MKGKQLPPHTPPFFVVPIAVHPIKHPTTNSSVANVTVYGTAIQHANATVGWITEQSIDVFVQKRDCPEWRVKVKMKLRKAVQIKKKPPPPPHPIQFFAPPVAHPKQPSLS